MPNDVKRPVFLNLFRIRQPVTALLSIGHRLSGVMLVFLVPVIVWMFDRSLASEAGYREVGERLHSLPARVILVGVIWFFAHHFFAGIRYLLLDADIGADIGRARITARIVFGAGLVVLVTAAVALL